jgi:hypothetical protein
LAGYVFGGEERDSGEKTRGIGTLDRVEYPVFCEARSCSDLASWRVGYQSKKGEFCSRHTVSLMRNRRPWFRHEQTGKE